MRFERGQNPKKALDIGAKPYEVIAAYLENPDGQKGNIRIFKDQLKSIWKNYIKRGIYQSFPEVPHFLLTVRVRDSGKVNIGLRVRDTR